MKIALPFTFILALVTLTANAQDIPTINPGCFQYGPNSCDLSSNPPSINSGGFHYGPRTAVGSPTGSQNSLKK